MREVEWCDSGGGSLSFLDFLLVSLSLWRSKNHYTLFLLFSLFSLSHYYVPSPAILLEGAMQTFERIPELWWHTHTLLAETPSCFTQTYYCACVQALPVFQPTKEYNLHMNIFLNLNFSYLVALVGCVWFNWIQILWKKQCLWYSVSITSFSMKTLSSIRFNSGKESIFQEIIF